MKILKGLLVFFLAVVVAIVLILGYLGFVPGVSSIFGSDKPRDLGVKYTQADYDSGGLKNKITYAAVDSAPDARSSIKFEGGHQVSNSWTSEEVTSRIDMNANWAYYPVKDVQLKFNEDGSVDAAGIVYVDRLKGYAEATKVPEDTIQAISKVFEQYKIPTGPVPVYMKLNLTIKDDNVDVLMPKLEVGRLPVPRSLYAPVKQAFEDFARQQLMGGGYGSFYIKSLDFKNGKLNFVGTLPDTVITAKKVLGL